jgi:hypothetical protein
VGGQALSLARPPFALAGGTETMTEMKLVEVSDEIDLSNWNIFDVVVDSPAKELDGVIATQVTQVLRAMFNNYPPLLELDPPVPEEPTGRRKSRASQPPLMLTLSLPLARPGDYGVDYSCSLESVVDELIETMSTPGQDTPEICADVATRLRELADKLDEAAR